MVASRETKVLLIISLIFACITGVLALSIFVLELGFLQFLRHEDNLVMLLFALIIPGGIAFGLFIQGMQSLGLDNRAGSLYHMNEDTLRQRLKQISNKDKIPMEEINNTIKTSLVRGEMNGILAFQWPRVLSVIFKLCLKNGLLAGFYDRQSHMFIVEGRIPSKYARPDPPPERVHVSPKPPPPKE